MARIRTVKPDFFCSPTIAGLRHRSRLTFIGLWTFVDDQGRGFDDARLVKAAVWPLDDDVTHACVAQDLDDLESAGLLERWRDDSTGRALLRVRSFLEHQRINRATPSRLPASPQEASLTAHGGLTETSPREVEVEMEVEMEVEVEREWGSDTGEQAREREVRTETRQRVAARRRKGEDIGPGVERLIRQDVERDIAERRDAIRRGAQHKGRTLVSYNEAEARQSLESEFDGDPVLVGEGLNAWREAREPTTTRQQAAS